MVALPRLDSASSSPSLNYIHLVNKTKGGKLCDRNELGNEISSLIAMAIALLAYLSPHQYLIKISRGKNKMVSNIDMK